MHRWRIALSLAVASLALAGSAAIVHAQAGEDNPPPSQPDRGGLIDRLAPDCSVNGNCNFCDVLDGFAILTRWILGISGAVALMMFVWFGFQLIMSQGNQATVGKARQGLVGTVIGLVVVFAAWEIVNVVLFVAVKPSQQIGNGLQSAPSLTNVILFQGSQPWQQYCKGRPGQVGNIPGVTGE